MPKLNDKDPPKNDKGLPKMVACLLEAEVSQTAYRLDRETKR
jgi:hypothetical protein